MNKEENKLHKLDSPEEKLTLKKIYKKSLDEDHIPGDLNNECKKNNTACTSLCDDDSILDFKSPKRTQPMQPKNINSKRLLDKSNKKTSRTNIKIIKHEKQRESSKLLRNKKIPHETQQTSIGSSFFKTETKIDALQNSAEMRTAYVCPLCFKSLKDEDSQATHMKNCAIKNNVSTKKLLDAMELQERQAAERRSLGLLSAPMLQDKKKPVSYKVASHDDPDLQLALALSKSLYEKEEMEIWGEAEIVAVSSSSSLIDSNKECSQRATLQTFGFTSNRNISSIQNCPNKMKRRKPIEPTILQRRTSTERERILTERIAEILMSYKDFTQKLQKEKEQPSNIKQRTIVKSQLLQQLHQMENTLWDRTKLTRNQNMFYVKQLSPQITASDRKQELNILKKEQNIIEVIDQNVNNEKCLDDKKDMINEKMEEMQVINIKNNEELITMNSNKTCKACCKEKKFLDIFATSWENILNDSSASDIIVLVKDNRHIWAHKLVFYVRCTNILLDITFNDTEVSTVKEKVCWIDIDYNSALAFLEFIYSGIINKYSKILDSNASLSTIRFLARKYKVNDLFAYLRHKEPRYNFAEVKRDYISKESTENIHANMEIASNASVLDKVTVSAPLNHLNDELENVQRTQLKENDNTSQSPEDNYITKENFDSLQSKEAVLMKPLQTLHSRDNTLTNQEINTSLDMFNDTTDIVKHKNKSITCSKDQDDSNINMLLNLIKQDKDIDICNQTLLTRRIRTEYSKVNENMSTCLQNAEQNITEIDSDFHPNSSKSPIEKLHKNLVTDTTQMNNPEIIQDCLPDIQKQKINLELFIKKIQAANSDSDLDSDLDLTIQSAQMSPIRYLNPFHKKRQDVPDNKDPMSHSDNIKLSTNPEEKIGRLSIVEQHMQSYAKKNPEFYFCLPNKTLPQAKQNNIWHTNATSSKKMIKFSHNPNNYIESSTPLTEKDISSLEQMNSSLSAVFPSHNKITNQSPNKNFYNSDTDEKEISMYSEYMRNHKNNSIAIYRPVIKKNKSDSDLSNQSVSFGSSHEDNDTDEDNEVLTQSILIQEDADVIDSSETEIGSISSSRSYSITLQNNDSDHVSHSIQSEKTRRITEYNKQNTENEKSKQLFQIEQISKTMTDLEAEKDINHTIKSNGHQSNINDVGIASDDTDFHMNLSQTKSGLDKWREDKTDCHKKEFTPSPIMVSSSPDFLHGENSLPNMKHDSKDIIKIDSHDSRSAECTFNFEDNIYLANVDIDQYEKQYDLEKNQLINTMISKKNNSYGYSNKSNKKNIIDNNTIINDTVLSCENLDRNAVPLREREIRNSTDIRKFKKKSLSEGQISINTSYNQRVISSNVSVQFQFNYNQNRNIPTDLKIIDRDITPPPNYDSMGTPELHKEMKRYGLKAQKRSRAVKLLTHIYNELHPLVPIEQTVTELSSEDDSPPRKKQNTNDNNLNKSNNMEDSDGELFYSQDSNESMSFLKNTISDELEFYETEQLSAELELENLPNIGEVFTRLVNIDKDLYNKILRYEPVNIEKLHSTLRAHGFKCKFSNLINFLDEQCITFYTAEQNARNETRRKANTE